MKSLNLKTTQAQEAQVFATIPSFPRYKVDSAGTQVIDTMTGIARNQYLNRGDASNSYYKVSLKTKQGFKKAYLHALVAEAWIGPRNEGEVIDHINGDEKDNSVQNLRYCSQKDNVKKGRKKKRCTRLKFSDIIMMRVLYKSGELDQNNKVINTIGYLAELYSMSYSGAWKICKYLSHNKKYLLEAEQKYTALYNSINNEID